MLIREVRVGQSIQIGDAVITLIHKSGSVARLAIDADKSIKITDLSKEQQSLHREASKYPQF